MYLKTFLDSALPFDPSGPSPGASTIHASLLQLLNAEASTLYDHPDINLKNSTNQIVSSKNQIAWYIEQRLLHEKNNSTAPPPPVPSRNESSRAEPAHVSLMLLEETDQDDLLDSMESTLDVCIKTKEGGFYEWLTGKDVNFIYDRRNVMNLVRSSNGDWHIHATNYGKIEITYDNGRDFRTWMLNVDQEDLSVIRKIGEIIIPNGSGPLLTIFNKIDELGIKYFRVDGWG